MKRSAERIRVSHAGALPRPGDLQELFDRGPAAQDAFTQALPQAVAEVVDHQVSAGVDVVNDGEISKRGLFIGYVRDRMSGFEARRFAPGEYTPPNAGVQGRDKRDFPGFFAAGLGGFQFGAAGHAAAHAGRGAAAAGRDHGLLLHRPAGLHRPGAVAGRHRAAAGRGGRAR